MSGKARGAGVKRVADGWAIYVGEDQLGVVPDGPVVFYDSQTREIRILAAEWDRDCIMDQDCCDQFVIELLNTQP